MNKVKPMKKMIFSSLAILAVSATLSHAGNIASSTQSGPYQHLHLYLNLVIIMPQ
jgi:hypothetical protein